MTGKYTVFCPRCKWYFWGNDYDVPRRQFFERMPHCPSCTELSHQQTALESHDGWTEYPGHKSKWSQT